MVNAADNLSAKKVKENYRKRFGIEASYRSCEESARLDNQCKCGISVCVDRNEFCADEHVARVTRKMDEKSASWESKLEMAEISAQTVRQFLAKSHRKLVWNGQRNRNAELKSVKINQIWIF